MGAALSVAIMTGMGTFFASVITVAYRFLKVEEDPRIDIVQDMLPGSNCGACGQPGCRAFAEKLVAGEEAPAACTVSANETVEAIADTLGVSAGEAIKRVARLHCAGGTHAAAQIADYQGFSTCRAASVVAGGGKGCAWGCLGLGDCDRVCDFNAIHMNAERLPVVNVEGCTACGDCVDVCPRDLFEILPLDLPVLVQCRVPLAGEAATAACSVACDACGLCAQDAPDGLIRMENNLPQVDLKAGIPVGEAGLPVGPEVVQRCPSGAIQWVLGQQFAPTDPTSWRRHVG